MTLRKMVSLLTLALLLAVPASLIHAQTGNNEVVVTKDDDGKTITLNVGDTLSIQLPANETTNYDWAPDPTNWVADATSEVTIIDVLPGSPAEKAGLQTGDIIRTVNGNPRLRGTIFNDLLASLSGQDVTLGIERNGKQQDISLTAAEFPDSGKTFLFVGEVTPGSSAEKAGLQAEDILLAADGTDLTSVQQLVDYISTHSDQEITLTIERQFKTMDIPITPGKDENGKPRLGVGVIELKPSIIGATVADLNIVANVGLTDASSGANPNQVILQLLTLQPVYTAENTGAAGAGGTWMIRFSAVAPGKTNLRLNFVPKDEQNPQPADTFAITIIVKGSAAPQNNNNNAAGTALTEADSGGSVTLKTGDTLTVQLNENQTTGYLWALDPSTDTSILRQVGEPQSIGPDTQAAGAGGSVIWTFEAAAPGQTTLILNLERSSDTNPETAKTFTVTVKVQ